MTTPKRNEAVAITPAGHVSKEALADYIYEWLTSLAPKEYGSLPRLLDDLYVMTGGMVKLYPANMVTALQGEVSRLRADAERYRYLRTQDGRYGVAYEARVMICGESLDAAIDKAMSNLEPPTDGR